MKKKKILIIGGTGFIGFHLIKKCLKKSFDVTSLSINKPSIKNPKVNYLFCDITKISKLKKKIMNEKFDYVVNLGGHANHFDKKKTFRSHYIGCKNLADIFLKKKIKSFIQLGSGLEYGSSTSPNKETQKCLPNSIYAKAKLKSTEYLIDLYKKKKFPCTIIRLYQAYGPQQSLNRLIPNTINFLLNNKLFPCSKGSQKRDFLFIDDLIRAIFLILKKKNCRGKILNIGYGRPVKVKSLIEKIKKIIKSGKPMYGQIKMRKDEFKNSYPKIDLAKKILNWSPKIKLDTGLFRTVKYYKMINKI